MSRAVFLILAAGALGIDALSVRAQDTNGAAPAPSPAGAAADNSAAAPQAQTDSDDSASFQTFYDSLASQGAWIQSIDYGYIWQPNVTDPNWAPYTDGHWVYTDDGWTWVSDESFGWATYHYGRWVNLDGYGWCWVPGYTWAPAWVSWRYGDGYCGWAPLPPDSFVGIDYSDDGSDLDGGFHIGGDCDSYYGIGAGCYVFLPVSYLGSGDYRHHYRNRYDNDGLINHTTNVTNLNVAANGAGDGGGTSGRGDFRRVTTGGPSLAEIDAVSETPVAKVRLVRANQPDGGGKVANDSLSLYAPHVNPGGKGQPPRVADTIGQTVVNRGTDITQPLAVNARLRPAPATEAEVREARMAQNNAPGSAKILTSTETVRPVLQGPLVSLTPMARQVISSRAGPGSPNAAGEVQVVPTVRTYSGTAPENTGSRFMQPGATYVPSAAVHPFHPATSTAGGGTEFHAPPRSSAPPASPAPAGGGDYQGGASGQGGGGGTHPESTGGSGQGSSRGGGTPGAGYQPGR